MTTSVGKRGGERDGGGREYGNETQKGGEKRERVETERERDVVLVQVLVSKTVASVGTLVHSSA